MVRLLRDASRWIVVAALVYAPWDYGATTERGIIVVSWLTTGAFALWLVSQLLNGVAARTRSSGESVRAISCRVPVALALLTSVLLLLGWWMVANAKSIYDDEQFMFVRVASVLPRLPGSIDQAISAAWMLRATGLLGTILIAADLARDGRCLLRLWVALAGTGGSIALLGLMQKASGAPMIFWRAAEQPVTTFFATFFYHGNAGAFMNLTLPLTIGLALRAFTRPGQPLWRAVWLLLAIVSVVAVFANTSRMGQFLGALITLAILGWLVPKLSRVLRRPRWSMAVVGVIALGFATYAIVQASQLDRAWKRWEQIDQTLRRDARWLAMQAAWRAVPEASWAGFGPGTFRVIFPYYTAGFDERLRGWWLFLHQDYLQTLLEWGWAGSALWAGIFFGGIFVALRNRLTKASEEWAPRQRLLLPLVLLGLASVAIHALVDFPLQIASIQLYSAALLGICWGSGNWARPLR